MGDRNNGIYRKFIVTRTDGASSAGKKHYGCRYFVLDVDHDPHSIPALMAYAKSAGNDGYLELAADIYKLLPNTGAEALRVDQIVSDMEQES